MGIKDTLFSRNLSINCGGELVDFSSPLIMGIVNITPDSFYKASRFTHPGNIEERVKQLINEGVDIIEAGAFSSRPGAEYIEPEEEKKRLLPAIEIIRKIAPDILLSVDTYRTDIARQLVSGYNVNIINDITAGIGDPEMFDFISSEKIPYVLMHMKGQPGTMQEDPVYKNVVDEVLWFLQERVNLLKEKGATDIIIDPGFGFGKTIGHNYSLLKSLDIFKCLELPVLAGISRKSMIYRVLGTDTESALNGTTALNMYAMLKGANILRVHDVKEAFECRKLFNKLESNEEE